MALQTPVLFACAVADVRAAEASKFRGMATLALIILNESHWSEAPQDHKKLRADLLHVATTSLGLEGPTWQAYAKGMDVMATKFATHFKGREFVLAHDEGEEPVMCNFDDIQTMSEEDAISAVMALYVAHGVTTGGQIRDWAGQEGFAPFDADLVKRQRKAKLDAKRQVEKDASASWTHTARIIPASATASNQDLAPVAATSFPDFVAHMLEADCLALIEAVNARLTRLAELAAISAAIEPDVMPVLSDDVVETASPNKVRRERAKKAA